MVAKKGRPLSDNPKKRTFTMRITQDEYELMENCAEMLDMNKSDVVLNAVKKVYSELSKTK